MHATLSLTAQTAVPNFKCILNHIPSKGVFKMNLTAKSPILTAAFLHYYISISSHCRVDILAVTTFKEVHIPSEDFVIV